MTPSNSAAGEFPPEQVLQFTRMFEAPRALVFKVWSSPEHVVRWYGPEGYALLSCDMDFREGGAWRFCMSNGPGHAHWIHGVYREIREPSRLSFTYINDYDGHEMLVTMDFIDRGERTEMHFQQAGFTRIEERDGHDWGWNSTIDLLAAYLLRFKDVVETTPIGRPRSDGVAEDIVAARRRAWEQREETADEDRRAENR
ncbi:MAG: hypothetical protein JWQ89_1930 [Devosia sp.]|uniref:SRPBCC family protein n=1 Tax=Devosia sp. TaxID=1871048 RepID=UPI002626D735|nr:SRPBCC domain-containing protein [Devosia sp.]MDB5540203.1 hypothetical protein [Devosia sp.]